MSKQIKVLLCEDVEKLGWLGDVVEVASGYARNYLLPHGLAMVPTEGNLRSLAEEKARRAKERLKKRERMEKAIKAVAGAEVVLAAKTNEQGHLFGSIAAHDIAENLRQQGFEVTDDVVKLAEHIKEAGKTDVTLRFAADLEAIVKVIVVSSDSEIQAKLEEIAALEAEQERKEKALAAEQQEEAEAAAESEEQEKED